LDRKRIEQEEDLTGRGSNRKGNGQEEEWTGLKENV